jgi:hypothetical protein
MLCRTSLLSISLISLAAQAFAQSAAYQPATVAPAVAAPGYNPGYYGRSSTLQEGIQHGYADVLRAEGEQAYNVARAADQFEVAREKWLNNRQQAVQQYFALRDVNRSYRSTQHNKPTTQKVSQVKSSRPATAAAVSLVGRDGQIAWPAAVAQLDASDARGQLEKLFARRASGHEVRSGSKEYRQGCEAIEKIQAELKASVRTIPTNEYMAAQKGLQSLKHNLTQPTDATLLTQN